MERIKCTERPTKFSAVCDQVTPGKFYDLYGSDVIDGHLHYTIIGDRGVEIRLPAGYFIRPLKKKVKKKSALVCGTCKCKMGAAA